MEGWALNMTIAMLAQIVLIAALELAHVQMFTPFATLMDIATPLNRLTFMILTSVLLGNARRPMINVHALM